MWPGSLALELGCPPTEERPDALLRIGGPKRGGEALRLRPQPFTEIRLGGHSLYLLYGDRRLLGHLSRPLERGVEQLVVRNDLVHEADAQRLVGADRRSRE